MNLVGCGDPGAFYAKGSHELGSRPRPGPDLTYGDLSYCHRHGETEDYQGGYGLSPGGGRPRPPRRMPHPDHQRCDRLEHRLCRPRHRPDATNRHSHRRSSHHPTLTSQPQPHQLLRPIRLHQPQTTTHRDSPTTTHRTAPPDFVHLMALPVVDSERQVPYR